MDNEALIAARENDLAKLQELLGRVDINARDAGKQRSLLYQAAKKGHREVVQWLLRNGADVLLATDKGNTALHAAVTRSDDDLVKVILENVARDKLRKLLNARTKANGTAALHAASKQNSRANVSILLQYGANYELKNNAGEKPVDLATREDLRQLLRLIGACFAKAESSDEPLNSDLENCDAADLTSLTNCRNSDGRTLLQVLVLHGSFPKFRPPNALLELRLSRSLDRDLRALRESSCHHQDDIDELAERARNCRRLWLERQRGPPTSQLRRVITGGAARDEMAREIETAMLKCFPSQAREAALLKSRELLLAYRRMEGKAKSSSTINAAVESLEELFEVFGYDEEQRHVVAGQSDRRQGQRMPTKLNQDSIPLFWRLIHEESLIHKSINGLFIHMTYAQMFHAVKNNDKRKMQQLVNDEDSHFPANQVDETGRTILYYAVENGSKTIMIKLLLKVGAKVCCKRGCECRALSPVHLAVNEGRVKIVKLLLKKIDVEDLAEVVDSRQGSAQDTALHTAAKLGRLDLAKMLLRYGATYSILDAEGRTALDVSSNEEVSELLKLVESCFEDAKHAKSEVVYKLKEMQTDDFLAIASTKNEEGQTLAVVAAKANAKNIAGMILRMIREAEGKKK